jgi:CHRD domain
MKSRLTLAGGVVALIAALTFPAADAAAPAVQLSANLKGAKEVPGPGDPNGKGEIFVAVKKQKRKVCFELRFRKIEDPEEGHIHKGGRNDAGPVKVLLFEDRAGLPGRRFEDCVKGKRKTLRKIARNPGRYYVNIHNDDYPDGAIRGQLKPAL